MPRIYTKTLPKGTVVYHGTQQPFRESQEDLNAPFWVSTSEGVARHFVTYNGAETPQPRIIKYRLNQKVKLLKIEGSREMEHLLEEHCTDCHRELAEILLEKGEDGWIIPTNYVDGDDIMLTDPGCLEYLGTEKIGDWEEDVEGEETEEDYALV